MRIVGIDQGTSSTRACVCEPDRAPKVVCMKSHAQHYPQAGWVEQDAPELLANIRACLAAAGPVDAIGIANQGESCVAGDARTGGMKCGTRSQFSALQQNGFHA